ncbi:MAG: hypothetical protein LBE08_02955 [Bifidobacteriaceae bacterium]|nr:hypothetical protein [Bifidobacteriaceae bacterium]
MNSTSETYTLAALASALRTDLDAVRFPFPAPASAAATERSERLAAHLDTAVLPVLRRQAPPAVVALVGGTGVGKSALANGLAGKVLSPAGPLRPTTKQPQLLADPTAAALLGAHPVLTKAQLRADPAVPAPWAILDCGDPFAAGNDPAVAQPDVPVGVWLVVTSALRYGDALTWDLLRAVGSSGTPTAFVVGRVPAGDWEIIRADITRRLEAVKLAFIPVFHVPAGASALQAVPLKCLEPIKDWLDGQLPAFGHPAPRNPSLPVAPLSAPLPPAPPLPSLAALAGQVKDLATDQLVHAQAVGLLRQATDRAAESLRAQARDALPGPPPPAVAAVWAALASHRGPLVDVAEAGVGVPPHRERWGSGLDSLGRAIDDAVSRTAAGSARAARVGMATAWRGADVPSGSRELAEAVAPAAAREAALRADELAGSDEPAGPSEPAGAGELAGSDEPAGAGELAGASEAAGAGLRDVPGGPVAGGAAPGDAALGEATAHQWTAAVSGAVADPGMVRAGRLAEALTQAGVVRLVQAAALSVAAPAEILAQLTGEEAGVLVDRSRAALEDALVGAVERALSPFRQALARVDQEPSRVLPWVAERLGKVAHREGV